MTWGDVALISTIEIAFFLAIFETYLDISDEYEIKELEDRVDKLHEWMSQNHDN
jgi:hypothetical protein